MNIQDIVVVIPIYQVDLKWYERISLKRVFEILSSYSIVFCCPKGLELTSIEEAYGRQNVERFNDDYFKGIEGYNRLMMSREFYERFLNYKYMLIYQLDAFVFSDKLDYFCNLDYDYIGAPWTQPVGTCEFKRNIYHFKVGNGGFSLRKIKACFDILKELSQVVLSWKENEDSFFSYCGYFNPEKFRIARFNVAMTFSFEASVRRLYKKNNSTLPFGCHAWMRFGGDVYPSLFKRVGVNIDEYNDLLGHEDLKHEFLIVKRRFRNKIIHIKTFDFILPYSKSWSIVCFGALGKRLAKFFLDNNIDIVSIYDSGFTNKQSEWNNIKCFNLNDMERLSVENGRIVIATLKFEKELIEKFGDSGLVYGKDYISLCREYATRFRRFGYEKYLYSNLNCL